MKERKGRTGGDRAGRAGRPRPSAAAEAGGATTPGSEFGGPGLRAAALKLVARLGRRVTGFAYRRLRELEQRARHRQDRVGPAGRPFRAGGGRGAPHPTAS